MRQHKVPISWVFLVTSSKIDELWVLRNHQISGRLGFVFVICESESIWLKRAIFDFILLHEHMLQILLFNILSFESSRPPSIWDLLFSNICNTLTNSKLIQFNILGFDKERVLASVYSSTNSHFERWWLLVEVWLIALSRLLADDDVLYQLEKVAFKTCREGLFECFAFDVLAIAYMREPLIHFIDKLFSLLAGIYHLVVVFG